jgi:hypothetical protein
MKGIFDQITAKNAIQRGPELSDEPLKNDETSSDETILEKYTPVVLKSMVQELLRYGIVEATRKPNRYKAAQQHQKEINDVLEPLDLLMELDEIRGIAFLKVAGQLFDKEEEWSHPLVRRQRFTLEQSLLVAILRQHFIAHEDDVGIGAEGAIVHIEDLLPQLQDFLGDLGSDAKEEKRLRNLLEKLKVHGIVSEIDAKDRLTIKPLIAHLANPESLETLLHHLKKLILEKQPVQPDGEC